MLLSVFCLCSFLLCLDDCHSYVLLLPECIHCSIPLFLYVFSVFFSHSFVFLSDPLACSLLLPLFSKVFISPISLSVSSPSFHTLHTIWRGNTDKRQCSEGYNMHSASRTLPVWESSSPLPPASCLTKEPINILFQLCATCLLGPKIYSTQVCKRECLVNASQGRSPLVNT